MVHPPVDDSILGRLFGEIAPRGGPATESTGIFTTTAKDSARRPLR